MATTGQFSGVAAAGILAGAFLPGQMFNATLSAAAGGLTFAVNGEFIASNVAAVGTLSAGAVLVSSLSDADITAAAGELTGSFAPGQTFAAQWQARGADLAAGYIKGQLFDCSMSAAVAPLTAQSTTWGQFRSELLAAPGVLSASAELDPSDSNYYFAAAAAGGLLAPVETSTAVYTIPVDAPFAWCVNLTTGGHSCYTEALASTIVTPATDFGVPNRKNVPDVYAYLRSEGTMMVYTLVDEQHMVAGKEIEPDGKAGIHRRRSARPRGASGTAWQFIIENSEGADFTLKQIEIPPEVSRRIAGRGGW